MANYEKVKVGSTTVKRVPLGRGERLSFSKIDEVIDMPNLIEIQKESYQWFLKEGLKEVFEDVSGIEDFNGNLVLDFVDYRLDDQPNYSVTECKERDATYSVPLRVTARLFNKETGEVQTSEVFMGDFPLMTESGTFVINGAERVIVSQLVRSPGVYYKMDYDKTGKELFSATVIPNRGAWLEYENDVNDVYYVRIDKNRKLPITQFIRALGLGSDMEIREMFGESDMLEATIAKDTTKNYEGGLFEVYKKLRPSEPPTVESAKSHIEGLFFDSRRYDISRVGRYKYNKKLNLEGRLTGQTLAEPIIDKYTGEILEEANSRITRERAAELDNLGVTEAFVWVGEKKRKILSNGMVDITKYVPFEVEELEKMGINERVSYAALREILDECGDDEHALKNQLRLRKKDLIPDHITIEDIFSTISYMLNLYEGLGTTDDIDHLGNRRTRCVGELLQNQVRIGFSRLERVIRERMTLQAQDSEQLSPHTLINIRPVVAAIKEFFGSSPLSQFMDQNNPLSELTHKRRLSALGPGGLSRDRASFEVRDVHYTHYGRMCPIESPEGPNIGLISYLATFARINHYGFIETPFRKVDPVTHCVTDEVEYMTADAEDEFIVAQANEPVDENGKFVNARVVCRYKDEFIEVGPEKIHYMDVSPKMVVSVATAMIPFLENDDANRALMGSNMQKQAVPLLKTQSPVVATGMEYKAAVDSGVCVLAKHAGVVEYVSADKVKIKTDDGRMDEYDIIKFLRSNQSTCVNQIPIVNKGDRVEAGEVIVDGPAIKNGEIALGKNALIGFMTWEGYNYEDAVLLNEKLVRDDIYTSIHIEEYEIECRDTKLGPEDITRDIPNVGEDMLRDLDERGIIRIGAEVVAGDILVGKVTPKGETELTAEERLLRAIFGEKAREVRDTSLRVPHGEYGTVVAVKEFTSENSKELSPGVKKVVRCYIAQKRKISVGDKMAGRHGNKGVVSRILPSEDMPFLEDGTPLDIVLNPLGVPSRMNIGQVLEVHLGMAATALGWKIMTPVFDGAHEDDIRAWFAEANRVKDERTFLRGVPFTQDGKFWLRDGRSGEYFDNPVTVGFMYYLKLHHLVDDKIHARSTGPYSLVTQQPLGGKAQFGGQRFGEMEVWALEAYGAAYTLQEILTVKSDDVVGRVKTYEAIVKGQNIPTPGIPESFKVLIKELQALGLDMKVLDKENNEIDLRQTFEDDDEGYANAAPDFEEKTVVDNLDGYTEENPEDAEDDSFSNPFDSDDGSDFFSQMAGAADEDDLFGGDDFGSDDLI
ncbi:MAG: DNA-directed RNA polymerase subunit beta [Clostridia bacterium]|nr:DNA-directed RNA polymerase subunit beta [Clostridia bacterium]